MDEMMPQDLMSWNSYIESLNDDQLIQKAEGANKVKFVDILQQEGMDAATISAILTKFAIELSQRGLAVPGFAIGRYTSLQMLLDIYNGSRVLSADDLTPPDYTPETAEAGSELE
jgi:hypothetical protein